MQTQERLQSLQKKRIALSNQIEREERSPSVDWTILRHMKKQKLELKELMENIREDHVASGKH